MNPTENQDSLGRVLRDWRLSPVRHAPFRAAVWQRIEAARTAQPWIAYVRVHARVVTGAVAVALVLGALIGREQARTRVASENNRLAAAYVQSLDARNMRMP